MENEVEINEIFRRGSSSTTAAGSPSLHVNELSSVNGLRSRHTLCYVLTRLCWKIVAGAMTDMLSENKSNIHLILTLLLIAACNERF